MSRNSRYLALTAVLALSLVAWIALGGFPTGSRAPRLVTVGLYDNAPST